MLWFLLLGVTHSSMAQQTMKKVPLTGKVATAHCIDGTPAVAYIYNNFESDDWIIWLEGGGICRSLSDCQKRAQGNLGSSKDYPDTRTASEGIFTDSTYATWNKVYIPYCSGDVWSGTIPTKMNPFPEPNPGNWTGYFQGHTIVQTAIDILEMAYGFKTAKSVILTGCSAGGVGTFINCDYVGFRAKNTKYACRPEAGWFGLPIKDYNSFTMNKADPDMRHLEWSNWTDFIQPWTIMSPESAKCIYDVRSKNVSVPYCEQQRLGEATCCGSPPVLYKYIKSPLFVSENSADSYQVFTQGQCPNQENQQVANYVLYLHGILYNSMKEQVVLGPKNKTDGIFSPACLKHCVPWVANTINGKTHAQAFNDWYFKGEKTLLLDSSIDVQHIKKCQNGNSPF